MQKEAGHLFEDKVITLLFRAGVDLERSEKLDMQLCVDFCLRRLPTYDLPKPIDVQLTFQGGNADKLEKFRKVKLNSGRDVLHLYAVVESGTKPEEAVFLLMLFAFVASRDGTFDRSTMLGVFINRNGTYEAFDIEERLAHLRQREDPVLSADRRILGQITALGRNESASLVSLEVGRRYHLRLGDVADPKLRALLRASEAFEEELIGRKVSFIAHGRYALSVLLA